LLASSWPRRACWLHAPPRVKSPCPPWVCVPGVPRLGLGVVARLVAGLALCVVAVARMMVVQSFRRFVKHLRPRWLVVSFSLDRRTSTRPFSRMIPLLPRLLPRDLVRRSSRTTCVWLRGERVVALVVRRALRGVGRNQLMRHLQVQDCAKKGRHTIVQDETAGLVIVSQGLSQTS
jgi:hypothetical protein